MPMVTKLGRFVTYHKGLPPAKTHDSLNTSHSHSGSKVMMILVCHVISQDHVIKGSCVPNFTGG